MSEHSSHSPEHKKTLFWPLDRVAKFIGDILLLPFRPPKS